MGLFGLGLALRPKDFNSKLSCKLNSIPRTALRRAQASPALKLGSSRILCSPSPDKEQPGLGTKTRGQGGVDGLIGAFDLVSAQLAQRDSQDWAEGVKVPPGRVNPLRQLPLPASPHRPGPTKSSVAGKDVRWISPTQRRQPAKRCSHLLWTSHPDQGPPSQITCVFSSFSNRSTQHLSLKLTKTQLNERPAPCRTRHPAHETRKATGTHHGKTAGGTATSRTRLNGKPWAGWYHKAEFTHADSVPLPPQPGTIAAPAEQKDARDSGSLHLLLPANPTQKPRN